VTGLHELIHLLVPICRLHQLKRSDGDCLWWIASSVFHPEKARAANLAKAGYYEAHDAVLIALIDNELRKRSMVDRMSVGPC
jgi:hypothetical protein